jgi:Tfp pilus assembly protein FimV
MQHVARVVMVMIGLQLSLASSLWAFAVGDIAVHSRRGEPFAANIRLLLEARERDKEIAVTLGNQDTYRGEGVKRTAVIDTLQAVLPPGTRDVIRLSSTVPLQEAAFDLVLLVRVGQVTIVKHYAVALLAPAPAALPMAAPLPTMAPVAPVASARKTGTKATRPPQRTGRYGPIERGETLYSIAKLLHVPNNKLWQGVVALWRANKEQFQGGNLHGLTVGTFLVIPSDLAEHMAALRLSEAQEIVAEQWEEWRTLQHGGSGLNKQPVIVAEHAADTPATGSTTPDLTATETEAAPRETTTPVPVEKIAEKPVPGQAVVLPVGKAGNMVSMAELQTVLQGLEERLMRRLTPIGQPEMQEVKLPAALVSTAELQASIQSLEERLTQRMQHMLSQIPEPVRIGQRPLQQTLASAQAPQATAAAQPVSLFLGPYMLVLTSTLFLLLGGALIWLWLRRRDRVERMQRV